MADEIIEELWKIKDGIAHEYAYNVDALVAHIKAKGLSAGQKVRGPEGNEIRRTKRRRGKINGKSPNQALELTDRSWPRRFAARPLAAAT